LCWIGGFGFGPAVELGTMRKRMILKVVRAVAGIAALVFLFVPLAKWSQVLLFVVSVAVFAICTIVSKNLDDTNDETKTGH
jgi:hypothetical protein